MAHPSLRRWDLTRHVTVGSGVKRGVVASPHASRHPDQADDIRADHLDFYDGDRSVESMA
jgi:hypothetical protein